MTPSASYRLYIGTYTRAGGKGIYALELNPVTGEFSRPTLAAETSNPSYLALSPDRKTLYAVSEAESMAAAFRVNPNDLRLTALPGSQEVGGKAPCHLAVDQTGRALVVANYHTGVVASFPIRSDGTLGAAASIIQHQGFSIDRERQSSPHTHSVTLSPDNRFVLVCDLGLDKIFSYRIDPATALLTPAEPPFAEAKPGSGPRHLTFSADGAHVFVLTEMGATLTSYRYHSENGSLTEIDVQSTLAAPPAVENRSAAVRLHPDGRFVYASNRGPDTLAVFSVDQQSGHLKRVAVIASGGKAPRDFALSPDGQWLVAANQDTNNLTLFRVSRETGLLTPAPATADISMPVCVVFA